MGDILLPPITLLTPRHILLTPIIPGLPHAELAIHPWAILHKHRDHPEHHRILRLLHDPKSWRGIRGTIQKNMGCHVFLGREWRVWRRKCQWGCGGLRSRGRGLVVRRESYYSEWRSLVQWGTLKLWGWRDRTQGRIWKRTQMDHELCHQVHLHAVRRRTGIVQQLLHDLPLNWPNPSSQTRLRRGILGVHHDSRTLERCL